MEMIWSILEGLHFESTTFFCQVSLFFLMHFLLTGLVYTPIMEIRNERDAKIGGRLAEAEKKAATARSLKEEFEAKIREARIEGQALVASETAKAEQARKVKVDEAREKASVILEEARAKAAAQREAALATVEQQVEHVSVVIAKQILRGSLAPEHSQVAEAKLGG